MSHPHCSICGGSGHGPGSEYLDCVAPGCTAAQERAALRKWYIRMPETSTEEELAWLAYQRGKAAAASIQGD